MPLVTKWRSYAFTKKELSKLDPQQRPNKGCLSTHWRAGPLKAFYDKTQAKFPKRWTKCKKQSLQRREKLSGTNQTADGYSTKLRAISYVACGRPPCAATITAQRMESTKA